MYLLVKTEVPTEKDEGISSSNNNNGEGVSADSGKVYTTVKLNTNYIQCLFLNCLFALNNAMAILIESK